MGPYVIFYKINISMVTVPDTSGITLRDQRHAYNFYTQNNHAFSPKVKFLYHIVFALNGLEVRDKAQETFDNLIEIAVMAKQVDLPKFRANIETKQQYNRKKNLQTRIDYEPVRFVFHDDNQGLTRKMLEDYYKYYFRDGKKDGGDGIPTDFSPLDKYSTLNAKYGMDNETTKPFFYYIKLFQFARRQWYSYTLINPILTGWEHDTLEYASSEPVENTINIAYEGVLYNSGNIDADLPDNFTSDDTRYDVVESPLKDSEILYGGSRSASSALSTSGGGFTNTGLSSSPSGVFGIQPFSNSPLFTTGFNSPLLSFGNLQQNTDTGIPGVLFPLQDTQNTPTFSTIQTTDSAFRNVGFMTDQLQLPNNRSLLLSLVKKLLASGIYGPIFNVTNFAQFDSLGVEQQNTIIEEILARLQNDIRIQNIASQILLNAGIKP